MFETTLGDPAGGAAVTKRQPDGNEVQRGGGEGEFLLFQGKKKNSDSETLTVMCTALNAPMAGLLPLSPVPVGRQLPACARCSN